eukprot:364572-Chlamydomonas_euryale.AAC.1
MHGLTLPGRLRRGARTRTAREAAGACGRVCRIMARQAARAAGGGPVLRGRRRYTQRYVRWCVRRYAGGLVRRAAGVQAGARGAGARAAAGRAASPLPLGA